MFSNFETYYGKRKAQQLEVILALMHLAVDLDQKEWYLELCERYNELWED